MTLLNVIYWVLVVLLVIIIFVPAGYMPIRNGGGIIEIGLFICIGIRSFKESVA